MKQHFDEIDIVKGIAILFVLWHHSFILYPIYMLDIPWCQYAIAIHGTFFLNVFFLVSGYLFANSTPRSFVANFRKKAGRLLVPYISYAIINLGIKLAFPSLVNRKVEGIDDYIWNFLFHGGELWFVYTLFLIFLVWPPVLNKIGKNGISVSILLLVFATTIIPANLYGEIFLYSEFLFYSIFFLSGYLLKDIDRSILSNNRYFSFSALLFCFFCVFFVQTEFIPYVWRFILAAIGCWFVWGLSFKLQKITSVNNALSFCGKNSLAFYWLNGFALVPARVLIVKILHIHNTPLIAICIFLICIICESVTILFIRKFPYIKNIIGI